MTVDRSTLAEVRNPLLALPAAKRILALPAPVRFALADLCRELSADAHARSDEAWRRRKGPMAVYWRAVGVYAGHLGRMIGRGG